jgi:aminoglycoside phosphotransferase (APT) family kinase protein
MATDDSEYVSRLVDREALESYLAEHLGSADTFSIERHTGGHSNETLFLQWGDRDLVLRRPPPGTTADSAHDVLREYTVYAAAQGTSIPVPETVLSCEDESVIGAEFYIMQRVSGDVIRDSEPDRFRSPTDRQRIGMELIETLADVHTLKYEQAGLGEFGQPSGFTQRQVDRWQSQYEWAFDVTADVRDIPAVAEIGEWLQANVPQAHPYTLVHGDYSIKNVMFGPGSPPTITAVFDWEMAALGDPFTDLGWFLRSWRGGESHIEALGAMSPPEFLSREGFPSKAALIERYESATGFEFKNSRFYRVLAFYKLGALGEMFFRRYREGNSADPYYEAMDETVPAVATHAKRIMQGEEPL